MRGQVNFEKKMKFREWSNQGLEVVRPTNSLKGAHARYRLDMIFFLEGCGLTKNCICIVYKPRLCWCWSASLFADKSKSFFSFQTNQNLKQQDVNAMWRLVGVRKTLPVRGGEDYPGALDLHTIYCPLTETTRVYMVSGQGSRPFSSIFVGQYHPWDLWPTYHFKLLNTWIKHNYIYV